MKKNICKGGIASPLLGLCFLSSFFFNACTHIYTARGVYYRIQKGDTLTKVAQKHKIGLQELAEINNIENLEEVKEGRSVYIPGVMVSSGSFSRFIEQEKNEGPSEKKSVEKVGEKEGKKEGEKEKVEAKVEEKEKKVKNASMMPPPLIEVDHDRFNWPIEGEITSLYGIRHGRRHDGVDIRAPKGSPVKASSNGEVVDSQRMRGYGNLILVKHDDGFFTVYAHNSVNLVKKGTRVKQGQLIAKVGRTGRATGPHLHFEIREGGKARNPLFFLPKTGYVQKAQNKEIDYGGPEGEVEGENP